MTVRPATVSDAASIAHVNLQTWRVAYRGQMPDAVLDALRVERSTVGWQERLGGSAASSISWVTGCLTDSCPSTPLRVFFELPRAFIA